MKETIQLDVMHAIHLPMSERVMDKLADILFATDEILDMMKLKEQVPDPTTADIHASVQSVYDKVNELMKKLAD